MNKWVIKLFSFILGIFGAFNQLRAQADLFYYLPEGVTYNQVIPTPKSIIGHEVGEWHITHDRLTYYFYELADISSRVKVEKYGQTYEYRPLLNVIITSTENHKKLEQLREDHLKISDPKKSNNLDLEDMPVVIRLGYSVHGNEASGANASMLVAYHFAAAQGKEIDELLENCIILIDPSLNPDGLQRFSTWVNEYKSKNLNADPSNLEFNEAWPRGRTNHYWFDLNRDWLLAQHPESIGRLKLYHDWKPNVQTDHHEMGSNATFFFQPGVPARKHPLIPGTNVSLTEKIGNYHAKALDNYKRLYYSKESFDDFYFGKGSTYPDLQGGIGILFEQASSRGHLQETDNGILSFPFAIKNHFITSLSTVKASFELKDELLSFQRDFYRTVSKEYKEDKSKAIIVGTQNDAARTIMLGQVLQRHQIEFYQPTRDLNFSNTIFPADKSIIIPLDQVQNKLIKAIFERRTTFQDSLFYDVSAWNFDLSYNLDMKWIDTKNVSNIIGNKITNLDLPKGTIFGSNAYAYAIHWDQYFAPGFVYELMKKGVKVNVATEPFQTSSGLKFDRGSIVIPVGPQEMSANETLELIEKYVAKYHVTVHAIESGLSSSGVDLGSNTLKTIKKPTIGLLVGDGVNAYEAGEVWHLLDQRYDMYVTLLATEHVDQVKLDRYNVLVLPGGSYGSLNAPAQEKLKNWVKEGGTLIAWKGALRLLSKLKIADVKFKKTVLDTSTIIPYADRSELRGAQVIGGAIFNMRIDKTHPLAYGYDQETLPVFKKGTLYLEPAKKSSSNPFRYTQNPLLSGYASKENIQLISGSPAICVSAFGEGKVIAFTDDHNFRAFWYGTNRLFINSIFFGSIISTR